MSRLEDQQTVSEAATGHASLRPLPPLRPPITEENKFNGTQDRHKSGSSEGELVSQSTVDVEEEKSTLMGSPRPAKTDDLAANALMDKLSSNVECKKLTEIRKQFLKGFIGDKLQESLPKCPIECMFWDWIYSYYPDNEISSVRFAGFTREFVTFLIDNKRFAEGYSNWIQQNQETLIKVAGTQKRLNVAPYDVKMYADMFRQIIKEKLNCGKHKAIFDEYAGSTVNGLPPKLPDELLSSHTCGTFCSRYAVSHLITFQHREFLRSNFARLFADKWLHKRAGSEIARPIGKASANPAVSKLKLVTKSRIEEILKEKLPKSCAKCGERTAEIKDVVENLVGIISQALDKVHEANNVALAPNLFKQHSSELTKYTWAVAQYWMCFLVYAWSQCLQVQLSAGISCIY